MLREGCHQLPGDLTAFYKLNKNGVLIGLLNTYVDDFIYTGTKELYDTVVKAICSEFSISKKLLSNFEFTGMKVSQGKDMTIKVDQRRYARTIEGIPPNHNDLTPAEQDKALRRIVGQCLYLTLTRPDICFLVNQISRSSSYDRGQRFTMAAKLLKMLKTYMPPLIYKHLGPIESLY